MAFQTIGAKVQRAHQENDNIVKAVVDGRKQAMDLKERLKHVRASHDDLAGVISEQARDLTVVYESVHQARRDFEAVTGGMREDITGLERWKIGVDGHLGNLERFTSDQRDYTSKSIRSLERDVVDLYKANDRLKKELDLSLHENSRLEMELAKIKIPDLRPVYAMAAVGLILAIMGCFI